MMAGNSTETMGVGASGSHSMASLIDEFDWSAEEAWFTFCFSPLRLSDGSVAGFMDTVIESTATVRARNDLALLNRELSHRLKNTLAIVQSIAMQTLKDAEPQDAVNAFRDRIQALGKAQDVLLNEGWSSVPLKEVAAQTLSPLDGLSQIVLDGPPITLGSRSTVMLSLILHELATNAAKYGALSVPDGCVDLKWAVEDEKVHLSWRERDGPPVVQPARRGFGSRLIERGFGSGSTVTTRFERTGVAIDIVVPATELLL